MRTLLEIHGRFSADMDDVLATFRTIPPYPGRQIARLGAHRIAREGAVTHTFDAWGRFTRSVILLSATRKVVGLSGAVYSPSPFRNFAAASACLTANKASISGFAYGEPQWHLQRAALDALRILGPTNAAHLSAALGASMASSAVPVSVANPVVELHKIRNYIAHKGRTAAAKSDPILEAQGARSVVDWLDQPVGGVSRFEEIVISLRVMATAAIQ